MNYDKPFLTYEELLDNLKKEKNLYIGNENLALEFLSSISYYDLINGYQEFFTTNSKYDENINFIFLVRFYYFDKNVQTTLFKYSVYVENTFKTRLAYCLSENYGVEVKNYLDVNNFIKTGYSPSRENKLKNLLSKIEEISKNTTDNPTIHYRLNHNHIPAWILLKNITFNDSIDLFNFLKKDDKLKIINTYFNNNNISDDDKIRIFKSAITIIRKFRNRIAHNLKPISFRSSESLLHKILINIIEPGLIVKKDLKNNIGVNDMYSMILSNILLLGNSYNKLLLLGELNAALSNEKDISQKYIEVANLPNNILERFEKAFNNIRNKKLNLHN